MAGNSVNKAAKTHRSIANPLQLSQALLTEADADAAAASDSEALKRFMSSQTAVDFGKTIRNSETF